jgi:hypothetical protein
MEIKIYLNCKRECGWNTEEAFEATMSVKVQARNIRRYNAFPNLT